MKKINYEKALAELELIVQKLESGELNLSEAVEAYEKGIELKNHCQTLLKNAHTKMEKIYNDENQQLNVTPVTNE